MTPLEPILNRLFYLYIFLFCASVFAQDSIVVEKPKPKSHVVFTEKDIRVDNDSIQQVHFSNSFKSKYKSDEFVYEVKLKEKNAWDRFKEWIADFFKRFFDFNQKDGPMSMVDLILKILAIVLIVFVVYLIVKSIMNKDGQWIFGKNSDKKVIRYDEIERNIHLVDFEKLIKETIESGEKRLAIRYYYLWLLKKMSEKELIEWDIEKTNSDYLYEIKNEDLKTRFGYLSYLYNYIWYGEFTIDEAEFEKAKTTFQKTIQSF